MPSSLAADDAALHKAVTFYASFDAKAEGDFGQGDLRLWTRTDDPSQKDKKVVRLWYDEKCIAIDRDGGVSGGALEFRERAKDNAFVYFLAGGKLAFQKGGWGGAVSLWVKADLEQIPEAGPWDPFLIVEKAWNDGAVWCDFAPGAAPRDLRVGLFPEVSPGKTPPSEHEGERIWLRAKAPPFSANSWHHIAQVWGNFDTGKADAWTACYLDGKLVGKVDGRDGTMAWNLDSVRFHIGSGLVGMIDEVALFGRPLSEDEVARLNEEPGIIKGLK
jgi:hypothetical protein